MKKHLVILTLAACVQPPAPVAERTEARGAVLHMGMAIYAVAKQCGVHAKWLAKFGPEQAENADRLYATCVRHLTPARDAVAFAPDQIEPWTPRSAAVVGCAGKAVRIAFLALREDFAAFRVTEPPLMTDGIHVGQWAERYALPSCDPLHPTTTVDTYEDPNIARIDPYERR